MQLYINNNLFSIMQFLKSCKYALQGIRHCLFAERNFKIQSVVAVAIFLSGILLHLKNYEWLVILFSAALVLGLELINTAIEKLSDVICPTIDPAIKKIKDMAAGAVFLTAIASFIIGLIIFLPKIEHLVKNYLK